jgi:hypothetical protein
VLQLNLTSVRSTPFLEMNKAQVNNDPCNGSPNGNNLFDMKMTNRPQYVFTIKPSELMNGNIYSRLTPFNKFADSHGMCSVFEVTKARIRL